MATDRRVSVAALITAAAAVAALASGCSSEPAVPSEIEPRTLTLLHIDTGPHLDPALSWFVDAVSERSAGAVTVEVTYSCCGEGANLEEQLVAAVADGEADLGWVGTRVFGELGVDSLAALTAPFLIGGYALERAALESSEADDALAAVRELDVVPLALVPGSIRYPLAAAEPVVSMESWSGLTISAFHSARNADALRALGAEPVDVPSKERDRGIYDGTIDALENSLIVQDRGREDTLPYATVDAGLWPRSSALIADPESGAASGDVAEVLQRAAADVVAETGKLGELDSAALATACADGARFALAGETEVTAMRDAVQPVLDAIAEDADAAPLMEAILALTSDHAAEVPPIPAGCDGDAPESEVSASDDPAVVNGRFQTADYTEQQLLEAGVPAQEAKNAAGQFTLVFQDGDFELIATQGSQTFGCDGEYNIDGDQLAIEYFPGGDCGSSGGLFFTATFVIDDEALTFTSIDATFETDEYLFASAPLARVG